jgi:hypothetical protein
MRFTCSRPSTRGILIFVVWIALQSMRFESLQVAALAPRDANAGSRRVSQREMASSEPLRNSH